MAVRNNATGETGTGGQTLEFYQQNVVPPELAANVATKKWCFMTFQGTSGCYNVNGQTTEVSGVSGSN